MSIVIKNHPVTTSPRFSNPPAFVVLILVNFVWLPVATNLDQPAFLVINEVVDRAARVYKLCDLFGRRVLERAGGGGGIDLAAEQVPRRVLFAELAAVAVDVQRLVALGVILPPLDRSVGVPPLDEPPQKVMLLLLGAQASLPACFGQLALAGNHAGRDACAPRRPRLPDLRRKFRKVLQHRIIG